VIWKDILDLPFENRILHQYIIAFAVYVERPVDDEMAVNLIGGTVNNHFFHRHSR